MDQNSTRRTMLQLGWVMAFLGIALIALGLAVASAQLILSALALAAGAAVSVAALPELDADQPMPNEGPGILRGLPAELARRTRRSSPIRAGR